MQHLIVMARALAILLHLSPIDRPREVYPGWAETPEARLRRYYSIASDVSEVALEGCRGNITCAKNTVATALGIAFHESGFAADVDAGKCYRGKNGDNQRCDGGNAHSMWQLHAFTCATGKWAPKVCVEGDLYDHDRKAAVRVALTRVASSRKACARFYAPKEELLANYAGGGCKLPMAMIRARELDDYIHRAAASPDLKELPPLPPEPEPEVAPPAPAPIDSGKVAVES